MIKKRKIMEKFAEYIRRVEIAELWHGKKHIIWHLDPKVNILSGANGIGKSTILKRLLSGVRILCSPDNQHTCGTTDIHPMQDVIIDTYPEDATLLRYDVISTPEVRSEFDENISCLQQRIVHYPHNERWALFCDIVDDMLSATEKTVHRDADILELEQWDETLDLRLLSSGEKQLLIILMTILLEDGEPTILLMDEPEVSLHMEWQQVLIDTIFRLNPNVQIILSTHSPAIIMNGWMDKVTEVDDITVE